MIVDELNAVQSLWTIWRMSVYKMFVDKMKSTRGHNDKMFVDKIGDC